MFDRLEAFVRDANKAQRKSDLADLLSEVSVEMGFSYFALTHHVDFKRAVSPAIRVANYPQEWVEFFDDHKLGPVDPVHRASQLTNVGFAWSRLDHLIRLTPRDHQLLELAARQGIGSGFTIPAHVPGESYGSCSFATNADKPLHAAQLPLAQLVGAFAFEAARRLWQVRHVDTRSFPQLTERQRECVLWAARGKSDWEIARILGLSHETVIQYLKRARERYGVSKRTVLAVRALFDGTISFSDVLRP